MSRVCAVLSGPLLSIFSAVHTISAGPCSALVRTVSAPSAAWADRKKQRSGYFPFFLQPLSSETSVGFKEKEKTAFISCCSRSSSYISVFSSTFLPSSVTHSLSPPVSVVALQPESIRCTAAFPPLGGIAAFCFFLLR